VDTHVARLRRKLEDDPRQPRHILTALTAGYRFQV
jgi:DNA-binding response OmpR family regulator